MGLRGSQGRRPPASGSTPALRVDAPFRAETAQKPPAQLAGYHQGYNLNLPLRFMRVKTEKSQFLKFPKDCVGRSAEERQPERRGQEGQMQTRESRYSHVEGSKVASLTPTAWGPQGWVESGNAGGGRCSGGLAVWQGERGQLRQVELGRIEVFSDPSLDGVRAATSPPYPTPYILALSLPSNL